MRQMGPLFGHVHGDLDFVFTFNNFRFINKYIVLSLFKFFILFS